MRHICNASSEVKGRWRVSIHMYTSASQIRRASTRNVQLALGSRGSLNVFETRVTSLTYPWRPLSQSLDSSLLLWFPLVLAPCICPRDRARGTRPYFSRGGFLLRPPTFSYLQEEVSDTARAAQLIKRTAARAVSLANSLAAVAMYTHSHTQLCVLIKLSVQ